MATGQERAASSSPDRNRAEFEPVDFNFKWTEEMTRQFIQIRICKNAMFTGKRNSSIAGWNIILEQMGISKLVTPEQARKRWTNMCQKYKELRSCMLERNEARPSWAYYNDIDVYFQMVEQSPPDFPSLNQVAASFCETVSISPQPKPPTGGMHQDSSPHRLQVGIKRKRKRSAQLGPATHTSTERHSEEDEVIQLLRRSLDSIQSLQETIKTQGETLVSLLTELVKKS